MASVRIVVSLAALALALTAAPARAACSRLCDEEYDLGGATDAPAAAHPSLHHRRPPPVAMTLPAWLWTKLREEAHAYADRTAYALITATSKLAVVAAREQQAAGDETATPREPAQHSECTAQGV